MAVNYSALKTELTTDPATLGLTALYNAGNDQGCADVLNFVRDGVTACPDNGVVGAAITVTRSDIAVSDAYAAIDVTDYTALPTNPSNTQLSTERRYLAWLTGMTAFSRMRLLNDDGTDAPPFKNLKAMFPSASATLTRLNALATRNGSRGEKLFGTDTLLSASDIALARKS